MHPVIRVLSLTLFCLLVSRGSIPVLITGFSLVIAFYVMTSLNYLYTAKIFLTRMRWFFLSIIIMYLWFTPGEALFSSESVLMPTVNGIELGITRVFSLLVIILAVNLFLQTTEKTLMMSALIWLTHPLNVFGDFQQRFAVRMALTLDAVSQVQTLCDFSKKNLLMNNVKKAPLKSRSSIAMSIAASITVPISTSISKISNVITEVYQQVLTKAENAPCEPLELPQSGSPPLYQWVYLPCLVVILL